MVLGGWPAFAILFVGAAIGRFYAARMTEVSAPAATPVAEAPAAPA
jgi:hypothetical protein